MKNILFRSSRQKRPDRAIYVPRQRRSVDTGVRPVTPHANGRDRLSLPLSKSPPTSPPDSANAPRTTLKKEKETTSDHNFECNNKGGGFQDFDNSPEHVDDLEITTQIVPRQSKIQDEQRITNNVQESPNLGENEETMNEWNKDTVEKDETNCVPDALIISQNNEKDEKRETEIEVPSNCSTTAFDCKNKRKGFDDYNYSLESVNDLEITKQFKIEDQQSVKAFRAKNVQDLGENVETMNKRNMDAKALEKVERRQMSLVSDVLIISQKNEQEEKKRESKIEPVVELTEKKVKHVEKSKSKAASPLSPPMEINRDECDWESLFDDNGDCLDPTLIDEVDNNAN